MPVDWQIGDANEILPDLASDGVGDIAAAPRHLEDSIPDRNFLDLSADVDPPRGLSIAEGDGPQRPRQNDARKRARDFPGVNRTAVDRWRVVFTVQHVYKNT